MRPLGPSARTPRPATSAEAWATSARSAPPLTTRCRAKGAIGTPNNVSRRRSYLLPPIVTPAPTYPCSVYLYDNYAPDCLLCFACGLLFYLRLRYGMSPLVQSCYDPVSYGHTPPSFNCPLPLVYLTRLCLPYCTPRPLFPSESPYMPLARQPLSLLVTEWHKFLSVPPVVQCILVHTSSQDLLNVFLHCAFPQYVDDIRLFLKFQPLISNKPHFRDSERNDALPILIGGFLD